MMTKAMHTIAIVILLLMAVKGIAQDANFSQYEMNPLYYNPAYTGDATDVRIGINYRNLWPNVPGMAFPGPLSTYDVYADKQFNNMLAGGAGLFVMQNFEGEGRLRHTQVGGLYSYHIPMPTKNFQISGGVKVSYNQLHIDFSKLVFSDQVDAERGYLSTPSAFTPYGNGTKHYVDIDAGVIMRANLFKIWTNEIGFSAAHLVRPNVSLEGLENKVPVKFIATYAASFPIMKEKLFISPKVLFETQGSFFAYTPGVTLYVTKRHFDANRYSYTKLLYLGFFFHSNNVNNGRNTKSFIANVGHTGSFGPNNTRYQLGLSYDFTLGGLSISSYGALELSATFIFMTKNSQKQSSRCPSFEGNPLGPNN